jgi:hypothetical protein
MTDKFPAIGNYIFGDKTLLNQRRIKNRLGSGIKTTPTGIENIDTTRLNTLFACIKLYVNLFFFISFSAKRIKLSFNYLANVQKNKTNTQIIFSKY